MKPVAIYNAFLHANLQGYTNHDRNVIAAFYLRENNISAMDSEVWLNPEVFADFKDFITIRWQGKPETTGIWKLPAMPPEQEPPETAEETARKAEQEIRKYNLLDLRMQGKHGRGKCKCGGTFKKRYSPKTDNFFLGCTNYPKCKITKPA